MDELKQDPAMDRQGRGEGSLHGQVVLVTGGGSGLGASLCRLLGASGASVFVGDLHLGQAQDVAGAVTEAGGTAQALQLDVGDAGMAAGAIDAIVQRAGRLDVLVNNAGTDITLPVSELGADDWLRVMATNLNGPFYLAKHAAAHMQARRDGQIINIASTAARRAWPNASAYHASKWGLLGLSHALHAELRPAGIRVTAVIAGGMRTPFLLERFPDIDVTTLQDPLNVALAIRSLLLLPRESVVAEIMVLPMKESSWP